MIEAVCSRCHKLRPMDPDRKTCRRCLRSISLKRRSNRSRKRCVECGKRAPQEGLKSCAFCLEARRKRRKDAAVDETRCSGCTRPRDGPEATCSGCREYQRENRELARLAGICIECGRLPRGITCRCEECRQKHNKRKRDADARRRKKKKKIQNGVS